MIVIRSDASLTLGIGHVMRCIALAETLKKHAEVLFICKQLPGNLIDYLKNLKFNVVSLPANLRVSEEPLFLFELFKNFSSIRWLIVDHYEIDYQWECMISTKVDKLLVIDDLNNRPHWADLLLNQNYDYSLVSYQDSVPDSCELLLGPTYALLRSEFSALCHDQQLNDSFQLLISFGGSDLTNQTYRVLNACLKLKQLIHLDVIIGHTNPHKQSLKNSFKSCNNITYHYQTEQMGSLMQQANLIIGAGGATLWECFSAGLPCLILNVAANQQSNSQRLAEDGFIFYLGTSHTVSEKSLLAGIKFAITANTRRDIMGKKCRELVDGLGVQRVVEKLR